MRGLYHDLRIIAPCKAREVVRKVLVHTNGNVAKTARILGISRPTEERETVSSMIAPEDP